MKKRFVHSSESGREMAKPSYRSLVKPEERIRHSMPIDESEEEFNGKITNEYTSSSARRGGTAKY